MTTIIEAKMSSQGDKETITSTAKAGTLLTRFSDTGRAFKVWRGLVDNGDKAKLIRNVVIQLFDKWAEKDIADLAETQARKMIEETTKCGKIKHTLTRRQE